MARSRKKSGQNKASNVVVPVVDGHQNGDNQDKDGDDDDQEPNVDLDLNEDDEQEKEEEEEESQEKGSTSDNYSGSDLNSSEDEEEDEEEDIEDEDDEDMNDDCDNEVSNGHRIEYESPDAINLLDAGDDEDGNDQRPVKKKRKTDAGVNDDDGHKDGGNHGDNDGQEGEKKEKIARPKLFKSAFDKSKRLIVILERANLELVKTRNNSFELINCDDHMSLIRKYRKDPAFCRPDITHQCLLMLFDSPLNRSGMLQVYIHTINNILIEINPQTRFPRTFKRFANLMVQLLYKMSIKSASGGNQKLLKVIKNPITSHLPVGCRKVGTSFQAEKLIKPSDLVPDPPADPNDAELPVVVVIGAMAHGQTGADYVEETVSISQYPLSGALACTKICSAFEEKWGIH